MDGWRALWLCACVRLSVCVQHEAHMAVLVQELLTPSHSFVLHTVSRGGPL